MSLQSRDSQATERRFRQGPLAPKALASDVPAALPLVREGQSTRIRRCPPQSPLSSMSGTGM